MLLLLLIIILGTILFKEKILNSEWIKELIVYGRAKYLFSLLILLQFTVWYFFGIKKLTASLIVLLIFLLFLNQEKKKLSNDNSVFPKTNYFSSFTFTVKYLLVFPIASIILFLSLYFIYKFDIFNIYHVSKMLHDQATLRNRTYHVWLFFNLYDFFLFLGIPVSVVIFKSLFTEIKNLKHIDFFLASLLFTVFILNLSVEPSSINCISKDFRLSAKPSPFNSNLIPDRASEGISTVCPKRLVQKVMMQKISRAILFKGNHSNMK